MHSETGSAVRMQVSIVAFYTLEAYFHTEAVEPTCSICLDTLAATPKLITFWTTMFQYVWASKFKWKNNQDNMLSQIGANLYYTSPI